MSDQGQLQGFDFHCHIDLHPDPVAVIDRCAREGLVVFAVTTTPKAWPQNCKWAAGSGYILVAAGLHPELVCERYAEADLLEQQIHDSRFIGEVGLDGSPRILKSIDKQKEIFRRTLNTAQILGGRVLSIHSRRAVRDVIEMIEERTDPGRVLCILHWFSGSVKEAQRAATAGCYFSVNQAMLDKERGRTLVKSLPINRMLTETDSPFNTIGNSKSMPWDVMMTMEHLAEIRGVSFTEMKRTLFANAWRVLNFANIEIPFHRMDKRAEE
jgi:TatD DNase family protein